MLSNAEFKRGLLELLGRIATALEQAPKPKRALTAAELAQRRAAAKTRTDKRKRNGARTESVEAQRNAGKATAALVATYCEAFKARYLTNPPITRRTAGQAAQLLKSLPLVRAQEIVQAYLQMDGERNWFKTRTHDFGCLVSNLNEVVAALANGTRTAGERDFWSKVFKEAGDGTKDLPGPDGANAGHVGRAALPRGAGGPAVEGIPRRK